MSVFAPMKKRAVKRLIASIQGPVKSGKTTLALTGPPPIGYISLEIGGSEGPGDKYVDDPNVRMAEIRMADPAYPENANEKQVQEAIQQAAFEAQNLFYEAYYESINNFRTTIVDTGSDLWELIRMANFGRLEKIQQLSYTVLNRQFDKLLDDAFSSNSNVIFIHHLKEKWEQYEENGKMKGRPSGVFEMVGYSGIKKKVQVVLETWREDLVEPDPVTDLSVKFGAQVMDSRLNAAAMGTRFEYDEIAFADIAAKVAGGSPKDWR